MLTLFHTAESNIGVFETAAKAAGYPGPLRHVLRDDLLKAAEAAGGLTDSIRAEVRDAIRAEAGGRLVCTCSTIGPGADDAAAEGLNVRRVDRALAEQALAAGPRIAVVYAVATTEGPTRDLFETVAREVCPDARIDMVLAEGAWERFRAGDAEGYFDRIAATVAELDPDCDAVALAQASMAPAAARCDRKVLTSPGAIFGA
ncbi:MAG: hypothetical protein ACMVY4_18420 [Minwuia sp.]|uniref:hypothetical protein n=1 Tax=Minwuia sp. TaxID=2493630 RepID=UPI003A8BE856